MVINYVYFNSFKHIGIFILYFTYLFNLITIIFSLLPINFFAKMFIVLINFILFINNNILLFFIIIEIITISLSFFLIYNSNKNKKIIIFNLIVTNLINLLFLLVFVLIFIFNYNNTNIMILTYPFYNLNNLLLFIFATSMLFKLGIYLGPKYYIYFYKLLSDKTLKVYLSFYYIIFPIFIFIFFQNFVVEYKLFFIILLILFNFLYFNLAKINIRELIFFSGQINIIYILILV